jgi:quinoprotein glucose dehydrogenase
MLPGLIAVALFAAAPASGWEQWGDRGGTRFSPLAQITPANIGNLPRAWEFRTGDLDTRAPAAMARTKFQQARCSSRIPSSSVRPSTMS